MKKHSPLSKKDRKKEEEEEEEEGEREREKGGEIHAIAKLSIHAFHSEM